MSECSQKLQKRRKNTTDYVNPELKNSFSKTSVFKWSISSQAKSTNFPCSQDSVDFKIMPNIDMRITTQN